VLYTTRLGRRGDWATSLIYGGNKHSNPGAPSKGFEHSLLLESNAQLDDQNSVFGRLEWVQKKAEELVVSGFAPDDRFDVASIVLGYIREVAEYQGASLGFGVRGSLSFIPEDLKPAYGTRTPGGIAIYARLRPSLFQRADTTNGEEAPQHRMPMRMR
jgi:hypothetical protein